MMRLVGIYRDGLPDIRWTRVVLYLMSAVVYVLVLFPIIVIVVASFNPTPDLRFPPAAISMRWYREFFGDSAMTESLITSLTVAVFATFFAVILGTFSAVALVRFNFKFKNLTGAFLLAPLVLPGLILGIALLLTFQAVDVPIMVRLVLAHTLLGIPFVIRSVMSSLDLFNTAIEEAACIHGASRVRAFLLITLPSIQSGIAAGAVFAFVASFGEINATLFLTGPGVSTLPVQIFSQIQFGAQQVIVAAASTVQMVLVIALVLVLEVSGISVTAER